MIASGRFRSLYQYKWQLIDGASDHVYAEANDWTFVEENDVLMGEAALTLFLDENSSQVELKTT